MERLTITLTTELARRVKATVQTGNYGSVSEVIRQALRDWELAEARRAQELKLLRQDVALGIGEAQAGMARSFDPARIEKASQRAALNELVRTSEDLGLYDNPSPPPPKSAFREGSPVKSKGRRKR